VILYVEDLDRSVAFYRDVAGFEPKLTRPDYAEFVMGGTKLGLYPRSRLPGLIGRPGGPGGPAGELAIIVDDVDAEARRLEHAGARIMSGPTDRPWGHRTLHVLDPDGFVVEFAQEIGRDRT
jgi:lactoylglutathione lyase